MGTVTVIHDDSGNGDFHFRMVEAIIRGRLK